MVSRAAFNFFHSINGSVGRHAVTALHLARAEHEAFRVRGWVGQWEDDQDGDLGDHAYWCKARDCKGVIGVDHRVEQAWVATGDHPSRALASLGGIIDANRDYVRLVEAELALEALAEEAKRESDLIKGIASELTAIRNMADDGCDVRLQLYSDGHWSVRFGDSGYDTDHRGFWGASSVPGNGWTFDAEETARDLYEQAMDAKSEGGE